MRRLGLAVALVASLAFLVPSGPAQSGAGFGTQVKSGDGDLSLAVRDAGSPSVCRLDTGTTGSMVDDGYYVVWAGGSTISTQSLRLVAWGGSAAGTLVGDADGAEKQTVPSGQCDATPQFCYVDFDGNGKYGLGDGAYVTSNGSPTDCVVSLDAGTVPPSWSVRLTPFGSKAGGTLVLNGDVDLGYYDAPDANADIPAAEFTYHDYDGSGGVSGPDYFWAASEAVGNGSKVPLYSIRVAYVPGSTTATTTTTMATTSTTSGPYTTSTTSSSSSSYAATATTWDWPTSTRTAVATRAAHLLAPGDESSSDAGAGQEASSSRDEPRLGALWIWIGFGGGGLVATGLMIALGAWLAKRSVTPRAARPHDWAQPQETGVPVWQAVPEPPALTPPAWSPAPQQPWPPATRAAHLTCPSCAAWVPFVPGTPPVCPACGYQGPHP